MFESLKKFLKVYPLPIFVLLLTFVVYYSAFELFKQKEEQQAPITQEESMQDVANETQIAQEDSKPQTQAPQATEESQALVESIEAQTEQEAIKALEDVLENMIQAPQQLPESRPMIYLTSSVKSLNIRQNPSIEAPIVGKLTPQQMMVGLEEKNGWILLADSNTKEPIGWGLKHFIKEVRILQNTANAQIQNPQNIEVPIYTSRVASLNIREMPNLEANILNKLTPDDAVSIVEINGVWARIQDINASGKNGWVVRRSLILRD